MHQVGLGSGNSQGQGSGSTARAPLAAALSTARPLDSGENSGGDRGRGPLRNLRRYRSKGIQFVRFVLASLLLSAARATLEESPAADRQIRQTATQCVGDFLRRLLAIGATLWATGVPAFTVRQSAPACAVRGSHEWLSQRGSPLDSATIIVGSRTAKVCYSRPSARGRVVFGGLVPYGRAWRTGANEPTVLHLPFPADVAGVRLDPGRYVLLTVPQPGDWIVVINRTEGDDPAEMFRNMVSIGQGAARSEPVDDYVATFSMRGNTGGTVAELILEWEHLRVRIPIRPLQ